MTRVTTQTKYQVEDLIRPHRDALRKIRTVSRADEMDADRHITDTRAVSQFTKDVRLYGMFEALLYAGSYPGDPLAFTHHILANHDIR
jgi:hypothetical protein